jgi:nicotinate-nucleotide pyrophosphorylase (carboxylating)
VNTARNLPELPQFLIDDAVTVALKEDLGRAGDITSQATIPPDASIEAAIIARQEGILAGLALSSSAFRQADARFSIADNIQDGTRIGKGQKIATISGAARAVLSAERVALNFLMLLSGVATATAAYQDRISHTKARITCTRKTIPGLRAFQKYAVRCGGGSSHRFGLDDAILIKDNHIAVCGGVAAALRSAKAFAGHLVKIEIEVDTLEQLEEALAQEAKVILLDNMSPQSLQKAVEMTAGRAILEASGNVGTDTIVPIAETGVDFISTSKITMAAAPLDFGLDYLDD